MLAGVFKVFGTSLTAERLVALLQQIGVVMGVYALARHWGRTVALPCALISLVIIVPPIGLTALGWVGAVALGLLGSGRGPGRQTHLRPETRRSLRPARRRAARASPCCTGST